MDDILFQSFQNVRNIVDNSIKLLKDADAFLAEKNYTPILGNGLASESSKSILQTKENPSTLTPQYIARPYALKDQLENGAVDHLLIINIQFMHHLHENLIPVIAAGRKILEKPTDNVRTAFQPWHMKYAIFEKGLKYDLYDGVMHTSIPFSDSIDTFTFFIKPLTTIKTNLDISEVVEKMSI